MARALLDRRPFTVAIEGYDPLDGETTPVELTSSTWSISACSIVAILASGAAGDEVIVRIRESASGPVIMRLGAATLAGEGAAVIDADGVAGFQVEQAIPSLTGMWWSFEGDSSGDYDLTFYLQPSVG